MNRIRLSLALTTSFACTFGPRFIGETAESSTGAADDSTGGDGSEPTPTDEDSADATSATLSDSTSGTDGCATSCTGEDAWPALFDGPARKLVLAADDSPIVFFSWPDLGAETRAVTKEGAVGPWTAIGAAQAGQLQDFARDDDGAALLFQHDDGYVVQGVTTDLQLVEWFGEREVAGEELHLYSSDVASVPGSGYVVAGVIGGGGGLAFVDAYDADGDEMFRWSQAFPGAYPAATAVLEDAEAITVWVLVQPAERDTLGDQHVLRFAADGTLLADDSLDSPGWYLPPLRTADGWVSIGVPHPNGGVRFDFLDAGFASTSVVVDPGVVPDDATFPVEACRTASGFALVIDPNDDPAYEVRAYDHEGTFLGAETVSVTMEGGYGGLLDLEAAADGTLYLLSDATHPDGGHQHDSRLHRFVF